MNKENEYVESLLDYIRKNPKFTKKPLKMAEGGDVAAPSQPAPTDESLQPQTDESPQPQNLGGFGGGSGTLTGLGATLGGATLGGATGPVGAAVGGMVGGAIPSVVDTLKNYIAGEKAPNTNLTPPTQNETRSTLGQPAGDISQPIKTFKEIYAATPDNYKKIIETNVQRMYKEEYGWMPSPPVSYKDFYNQLMQETKGFKPINTGGILNYGDPAGADAYNKGIDLVRSMSQIDFSKAMDYGIGGWANQPGLLGSGLKGWANLQNTLGITGGSPKLQAARYNYERLVDTIAAAVTPQGTNTKASTPAVENMLMELRTSGMNKTQMKSQLFNTLETRMGVPLSGLDNMGLTDAYFKKNINYK